MSAEPVAGSDSATGSDRATRALNLRMFGKLVALEARLEPGQRVEIYRPITADPKLLLPAGSDDED